MGSIWYVCARVCAKGSSPHSQTTRNQEETYASRHRTISSDIFYIRVLGVCPCVLTNGDIFIIKSNNDHRTRNESSFFNYRVSEYESFY